MRQQMCTARAPAQVFGAEGDRGIFGADSPTHSVTTHTHSLLPPLPSSPAHVATYHRFVTFVLAPFERFAPCQKPARRRNLQRSPERACTGSISYNLWAVHDALKRQRQKPPH